MFGYKIMKDPRRSRPYKVGLALSGGGARGVAHAGAIKAMEEVGLRPDIVAGVSAGSIAAVMYAAGITPDEMFEIFATARFADFARLGVPSGGLFRMDGFKRMLRERIPYRNLEDLPMPAVVAATNYDLGIRTAFTTGSIPERVCASCCIPVVFKPQVIDGTRYVDGGVLDNMPAWTIREQCRFLVGVNVSPAVSRATESNSLLSMALRSYELMMKNNSAADQRMCDMLITTSDIASYPVFDLQNLRQVFDSGYRATMEYFRAHGIVR